MTVKELKKKLNEFDENLEILVSTGDFRSDKILSVESGKPVTEDDELNEELAGITHQSVEELIHDLILDQAAYMPLDKIPITEKELEGLRHSMEEYLKSAKIIEDLRVCIEYLRELCNSKHEKNICKSMLDLNECRLFLKKELHKGDLSFHTYPIGYFCEAVSSYEEAVKRINLVFDKIKGEDEKAVRLLENIIILMGKNLLYL